MPICPHCYKKGKETKLRHVLKNPHRVTISYFCNRCKIEFYIVTGGKLLTRKEFFEQEREFNG